MSNSLTPSQDLLVRRFYTEIVGDDSLHVWDEINRRNVLKTCLTLLGYVMYQGKHVYPEDLEKGVRYGRDLEVEDRWEEDTKKVEAALYGESPSTPDSSESSESTEVREAVLPQDV